MKNSQCCALLSGLNPATLVTSLINKLGDVLAMFQSTDIEEETDRHRSIETLNKLNANVTCINSAELALSEQAEQKLL